MFSSKPSFHQWPFKGITVIPMKADKQKKITTKNIIMEIPHEMTTLSDVLEKLRLKKFDTEFQWEEKGFSAGKGKIYQPADLEIIKVYRFEESTNPSDMCILYLFEAKDGLVGYSLDAYGVYSNYDIDYENFIRLVPERNHEQQILFKI